MTAQKKKLLTTAGVIALLCTLLLIYHFFRQRLIALVQNVAIELRIIPFGWLLLSLCILITSIPPVLGFTFITTLTGFVYGFPGGIVPGALGAFFGGIIAFFLIRKYNFARFIRLSPSKQEKYIAMQEAIEQGGFKMMLLIRLSPIPWPFINMLLALIPTITTERFILVTFVASFKVAMEVWIGSQFADLSNPDLPPSAHRVALITMGFGLVILVGVAWWIYRLTMQKVEEISKRQHGGILGKNGGGENILLRPSSLKKKLDSDSDVDLISLSTVIAMDNSGSIDNGNTVKSSKRLSAPITSPSKKQA